MLCHSYIADAYKKRLEDILNDIILISEIAELSAESESIATMIGIKKEDINIEPPIEVKAATNQRMGRVRWSIVKFDGDCSNKSRSSSGMIDDGEDDGSDNEELESDDEDGGSEVKGGLYESSRRPYIKELLDKWEEPLSKRDQVSLTSRSVLLAPSFFWRWSYLSMFVLLF